MDYYLKIGQAEEILENLKSEVLQIISETNNLEYTCQQNLLPWIEEETEYQIKKLKLKPTDQSYYLMKIHRILGVYSDEIPHLKRDWKKKPGK